MIALPRPGTPAWTVLATLVELGEATAEELAGRLLVLPVLTHSHLQRADRLEVLRDRQRRREEEQRRVSRVLGRLQERGLAEARGRAHLSGSWTRLAAKRGAGEALRCMSCWSVRGPNIGAYLRLLEEVEKQPGCVSHLTGRQAIHYRQLVSWDVVIPPSMRRPTEAGIALVTGACP